jgi:sarcosine oxidase subunit alpha
MSARLPDHPAQRADGSRWLSFTVDGRRVEARQGESIAAAAYAAGITTFSRSFKYHRRRGLLCAAGRCPNCLMTVDGVPNVRTCIAPARDGSIVRSQHAWPSLDFDVQAVLNWCAPLIPVGFYYKTFMRPRWLWPAYEAVLRRLAGLGRLDVGRTHDHHPEIEHLHTDVAVVGGGPAGMQAALEAARLGVDVVLVDDQPQLGGHLRWNRLPSNGQQPDFQVAKALSDKVQTTPGILHLHDASAFGLYDGRLLGITQHERLIRLRAERIVVAAGGFEHPLLFDNNDLPGIFLSEGIRRLITLDGIRPGRRAVVVVNDDRGVKAAHELIGAGIEVAAVADARPHVSPRATELATRGTTVLPGHSVVRAHGSRRVSAVTLAKLDDAGQPLPGERRRVAADLLVLATGWEPNNTLLAQHECRLHHDEAAGAFFATDLPDWLIAAGEVAGCRQLDDVLGDGRRAGLRAAVSLGAGDERDRTAAAAGRLGDERGAVRPLVAVGDPQAKQFVCLCEDVTVTDIKDATREGFDDIQTLKRYSTVTMGPCQGKMCHHASVAVCAAATGTGVARTGTTTMRPPAAPVLLGALAGAAHEPVRRTPLHAQHETGGATWLDMGAWKRPLVYSSVEHECEAVHNRVGIIDVSTLGKLDVKGRDAAEFLEWLHPNRVANLKTGRIRYRLMLDDSGIILDDGTIARLGEDHFFVTTGTGALEMVEQWLDWWLATSDRCTHVTNVTGAFAAVNVAGPRSRELLARLTDLDLSSEAVPYLATVEAAIAGVPARLLRIGFVGELGYEIHFPSEYGDYLWTTLLEVGRDLGIAPFGVEAQRVLRLEKLHIIPGHDTDALSNPLEADMAWTVKMEKPDFVGRAALASLEGRPARQRLVGFQMTDDRLPYEGDAVIERRSPVGRVTSAKWSPLLKRAIGMAWVPSEFAVDGREFEIRSDGKDLAARVTLKPFYDPEGHRLKS